MNNEIINRLIGAKIKCKMYGYGIIKDITFDGTEYYVNISFDSDGEKTSRVFCANIAFDNNILHFESDKNAELFQSIIKKAKETTPQIDFNKKNNKISNNETIDKLAKKIENQESIALDLIKLFDNEEFENKLYQEAFALFEKVMDSVKIEYKKTCCIILAFSYIALKYYNGDLHSYIESIYRSSRTITEKNYPSTAIKRGFYNVTKDYRKKTMYFDEKSYVAVPIVLSCVPYYRVNDLFRLSYDIYKRKLLFDEDITDDQIEEKVAEVFLILKRKDLVQNDDKIKGTEYLMSKYTQSCIYSGKCFDVLVKIVSHCVRLIIDYLTMSSDAFCAETYYLEGFSKWINCFENDTREKERYKSEKELSKPKYKLKNDNLVTLITGSVSMDDSFDPSNVKVVVFEDEHVIEEKLLDGPNDIVYNEDNSVIGGYIINRVELPLSDTALGNISYKIICDEKDVYDSKKKLFRKVLFFDGNGGEIKSGTEYDGELFVVTRNNNESEYGSKINTIYSGTNYFVSTIEVNSNDVFYFDGDPYIFYKVSRPQNIGYLLPWANYIDVESNVHNIYKSMIFVFKSSCLKEDLLFEINGDLYIYSEKNIMVGLYSNDYNGGFTYKVRFYDFDPGYYKIRILNAKTKKEINGACFNFIYDPIITRKIANRDDRGIDYLLNADFLEEQMISLNFGSSEERVKCFIKNLGYGFLCIYPSTVSYSLDGITWYGYRTDLYLGDVKNNSIYICGPKNLNIYFSGTDSAFEKRIANFEKYEGENMIYKLYLDYLKGLKNLKVANIGFEFAGQLQKLNVQYYPYIIKEKCCFYFDREKDSQMFHFEFSGSNEIRVEILSLRGEKQLLLADITSGETIELNASTVDSNIKYVSVRLFAKKHSTSLLSKFEEEPFYIFPKYYLGEVNVSFDKENEIIDFNDLTDEFGIRFCFTGAEKLLMHLYAKVNNELIFEERINSGELYKLDVSNLLYDDFILKLFLPKHEDDYVDFEDAPIVSRNLECSRFINKKFKIEKFLLKDNTEVNSSYVLYFTEIRKYNGRWYLYGKMRQEYETVYINDIYASIVRKNKQLYEIKLYRLKDDSLKMMTLKTSKGISGCIIKKVGDLL